MARLLQAGLLSAIVIPALAASLDNAPTPPTSNWIIHHKGWEVSQPTTFASFDNATFKFQSDTNLIVYKSDGKTSLWAGMNTLTGCGAPNGAFVCSMRFDEDGNLGTYFRDQALTSSNTAGKGQMLLISESAPYLKVMDRTGKNAWDTTKSFKVPYPKSYTVPRGWSANETGTLMFVDGYSLLQQSDSDIVVHDNSGATHWSGGIGGQKCITNGKSSCETRFDQIGNLATYFNGKAIFQSNTAGRGYTFTFLNSDPWISIQDVSGQDIYQGTHGVVVQPGPSITYPLNYSLNMSGVMSQMDTCNLQLQSDGNFVLYTNSPQTALWASDASPADGCYDSNNNYICSAYFDGTGNLATYKGDTMLWSTKTGGKGKTWKVQCQKPYMSVLDANGNAVYSSGS